jgi:hypothetical protein
MGPFIPSTAIWMRSPGFTASLITTRFGILNP